MMLDRKLYKTKLCVLYQRGNCPRRSCSFAHGRSELRRFSHDSPPLPGRRDHRISDMRDKLDRRLSPHQRHSPGRDTRGRHAFHGQRSIPDDRGYSLSRSPMGKRQRKKHHLDGQSDASESPRNSDGAEDRIKEGKVSSYDKHVLEEQLKQSQLDIDMLDDHKSQLKMALEEKVQEADGLAARIQEFEFQLSKEQEDCRRMTSKIKKFVKAYSRYSLAQEELKKTETRLQRLGEQLGSDISRFGVNEEDSSINIVSDGENKSDTQMSLRNELKNNLSPSKEGQQAKPVTSHKKEGPLLRTTRLEKFTQWDRPLQSEKKSKEADTTTTLLIGNTTYRPLANEKKRKWGNNDASNISTPDKVKAPESGHFLPSTSMAAHAVDDLIETIDQEDKLELTSSATVVHNLIKPTGEEKLVMGDATTTAFDNVTVDGKAGLPYLLPRPPPTSQNAYKQYEGQDEDVDVEDVDVDV